MQGAACVALPSTSNFACLVLGGFKEDEDDEDEYKLLSDVYGLNKKLTEWTFLGKMREGICNHVGLLLS